METFFSKILKTDSCWIWTGAKTKNGYGVLKMTNSRKNVRAHRLSYIIHKGEIPDGLLVCHTCDVRACVNPDHLFLGTHYENSLDAKRKGRLKIPEQKHPSYSAYTSRGCRCNECKEIYAIYQKNYIERNKDKIKSYYLKRKLK